MEWRSLEPKIKCERHVIYIDLGTEKLPKQQNRRRRTTEEVSDGNGESKTSNLKLIRAKGRAHISCLTNVTRFKTKGRGRPQGKMISEKSRFPHRGRSMPIHVIPQQNTSIDCADYHVIFSYPKCSSWDLNTRCPKMECWWVVAMEMKNWQSSPNIVLIGVGNWLSLARSNTCLQRALKVESGWNSTERTTKMVRLKTLRMRPWQRTVDKWIRWSVVKQILEEIDFLIELCMVEECVVSTFLVDVNNCVELQRKTSRDSFPHYVV